MVMLVLPEGVISPTVLRRSSKLLVSGRSCVSEPVPAHRPPGQRSCHRAGIVGIVGHVVIGDAAAPITAGDPQAARDVGIEIQESGVAVVLTEVYLRITARSRP